MLITHTLEWLTPFPETFIPVKHHQLNCSCSFTLSKLFSARFDAFFGFFSDQILALSMMNSDAKDFLTFVQGYHQLFCGASDLIKLDEDHRPSANAPHTPPILSKTFKVDINEVSAIFSSNQLVVPIFFKLPNQQWA